MWIFANKLRITVRETFFFPHSLRARMSKQADKQLPPAREWIVDDRLEIEIRMKKRKSFPQRRVTHKSDKEA